MHYPTHIPSTLPVSLPPTVGPIYFSAPSFKPPFPPEVFEYIIDALYSDEDFYNLYYLSLRARTLRHCTFVCRAWRPRAQFWLLRSVILRPPHFRQSMCKLVKAPKLFPRFANYVRDLTLECGNHDENGFTYNSIVFCLGFGSLGNIFPLLRKLGLVAPPLNKALPPCLVTIHEYFPVNPHFPRYGIFKQISALHLSGITMVTFLEFANFLRCFPRLETLDCAGVCWSEHHTYAPTETYDQTKLSRHQFLFNLRTLCVRLICCVILGIRDH